MIGGSLAAAFAVATAAFAIESSQSSWDLRPLVSEARELVGEAREQTVALDYRLARGSNARTGASDYGGGPLKTSGSYEYSDLKRTATRFSDLGNEILDKASHCGEDARKIALNFRSRTQSFARSVRSVASSSSSSLARMSISKIENDINAIEQSLQGVASLSGCSKQSDDDEEGAEKSS